MQTITVGFPIDACVRSEHSHKSFFLATKSTLPLLVPLCIERLTWCAERAAKKEDGKEGDESARRPGKVSRVDISDSGGKVEQLFNVSKIHVRKFYPHHSATLILI